MHLSIRTPLAAAVLLTFAGVAAANATHDAFVDVAGSDAFDGFNQLTSARITTPQLVAGIASNVAGSANDATLKRLTGGFYPASFGLYSWSTDSAFAVNVGSAIANLGTITLQSFVTVDTSQGVDGLLQAGYLPTLSINGGAQTIAATSYSLTPVSGGFGMDGSPLPASANNPNYGYFTWDLSSVSTPVTSFAVSFGLDTHSSALAFQLDQSAITAAVPEPGSYALMLAGMGAVGFLARRRKAAN